MHNEQYEHRANHYQHTAARPIKRARYPLAWCSAGLRFMAFKDIATWVSNLRFGSIRTIG
jgi:hypothetical protein